MHTFVGKYVLENVENSITRYTEPSFLVFVSRIIPLHCLPRSWCLSRWWTAKSSLTRLIESSFLWQVTSCPSSQQIKGHFWEQLPNWLYRTFQIVGSSAYQLCHRHGDNVTVVLAVERSLLNWLFWLRRGGSQPYSLFHYFLISFQTKLCLVNIFSMISMEKKYEKNITSRFIKDNINNSPTKKPLKYLHIFWKIMLSLFICLYFSYRTV